VVAEPSSPGTAVRMVNIDKYFGSVCALKNVNFEVGRNEIVGLIGDNGAGKSTVVKILTGVFPPSDGELYVADKKVDTASASRRSIRTSPSGRSRHCGATFSSAGR
jgi:simple sugar transport system ATP-binding protein